MAFENVFGNVRFDIPVNQANTDRQFFADMLGRGIQQAQFKQKMDLREKQLEQKQAADLGQLAETGAMKAEMGMPLSPQEQAALNVYGKVKGPSVYTDSFGNQVVRPSGWSKYSKGANLDTGQGTFTGQPVPEYARGGGETVFRGSPAVNTPYDQIQPDITNEDLVNMGYQDVYQAIDGPVGVDAPPEDMGKTDLDRMYNQIPAYNAPEYFGAKGKIMEEESKREITEDIAKKRVDLMFEREKELRNLPKAERRIVESAYEFGNVANNIDEAISMVSPYSAGLGSLSSIIPATPARDLEAKLKNIRADAAFGALQKMRDNSKTGGALGQVSERELGLLESAQAPLDQGQSGPQLIEALQNYKNVRTQALSRVADAFEQDYGYRPKGFDNLINEMGGGKSTADWKEYFQ